MFTGVRRNPARLVRRALAVSLAAAALGGSGFATAATTANAAAKPGARGLNWADATLELRDLDVRCPGGPLRFAGGYAEVDTGATTPSSFFQGPVKFGDVNRDGRDDAVLSVACWPNGHSQYALTATYAYGVENGAPKLIGAVTTPPVAPESYSVRTGKVTVKARPDGDETSPLLTFTLRWDGKSFQERSGKAAYLYDWGNARLALPFTAAAVPMGDGSRDCTRITVPFAGNPRQGEFVSDDELSYGLRANEFGDVNRDGVTDVRVSLSCFDRRVWARPAVWNYVYTIKNGKPALLSYLTASDSAAGFTAIGDVKLSRGKVTLTQFAGTSDVQVDRTFRWTRNGLTAQQPLSGHPTVDVAP
jgi:hypothetical protein